MELLDELTARGATVLIPVLLEDLDLGWSIWGDATQQRLSPAAIATVDTVLVPALAVARDGTRLGRGGGSYDRALARVPADCPVIALIYEDEFVDALPRESWDRPVTAVATPTRYLEISTPSV